MVLRRLYRMAVHDTDETFGGRRDFLKLAAGAAITEEAGRELADDGGDETTVLDALSPHQVEEAVAKIKVDISYRESEVTGNPNNTNTPTGPGTPESNSTPTGGSSRIVDYKDFETGLKSQSPESLTYVEGALEADPGDVNDVSFESDGLYIDSTVAEWDHPDMDQSMRTYLENAEQSGDLDEWLSKYEKQNL